MALNIQKTLTELGLTDTETRVYLAMLELGADSVQNIAKGAKISRTAAYEIIKALQAKGLASTFEKGKKTFFSAEDPDKLGDYFRNRVERMKIQLGSLDRLLPELRVMKGGEQPRVLFYTGEEGVRALFRDVVAMNATELLEVTNIDTVYTFVDGKVLNEARKAEGYKDIPVKVLHRGEVRNPNPKAEFRRLEDGFGDFQGNIWIYRSHVAFVSFVGSIEVVIIENPIFAETMRALFQACWSSSKKR